MLGGPGRSLVAPLLPPKYFAGHVIPSLSPYTGCWCSDWCILMLTSQNALVTLSTHMPMLWRPGRPPIADLLPPKYFTNHVIPSLSPCTSDWCILMLTSQIASVSLSTHIWMLGGPGRSPVADLLPPKYVAGAIIPSPSPYTGNWCSNWCILPLAVQNASVWFVRHIPMLGGPGPLPVTDLLHSINSHGSHSPYHFAQCQSIY